MNVLLYRLPRNENFINARSKCPHCSYRLVWFDLVPLISFVLLRGRCRKCRQPIGRRYPSIELLFAVLSLAVFLNFSNDFLLMSFWLVITALFVALFLFDLKYLILPDLLLIWLAVFFLAYEIIYEVLGRQWFLVSWQNSLLAAVGMALLLGAIWWFSDGRWLGFGDVKLGFMIGLIFGIAGAGFILYAAVIMGGAVALTLLIAGRATLKTKLPLGSFISIAAIAYILYQIPINNFLNRFLL